MLLEFINRKCVMNDLTNLANYRSLQVKKIRD